MKALTEFVNKLDDFKQEAWSRRWNKGDSAQKLMDSIVWRKIDKWKAGLNYHETEAGAWFAVFSVTVGTPDEWKIPLMEAVATLAGKLVKPEIGDRSVKFHWRVEEDDVG